MLAALPWAPLHSACPRESLNDLDERSSFTSCSANQTRAGCRTDEALPSLPYTRYFGDSKLCLRRGGRPAKGRPIPTATKGCPSDTVLCGGTTGATWDANRATCQPSAAQCPLVNVTWAPAPVNASAPRGTRIVPVPELGMAFYLATELLDPSVLSSASAGFGPLLSMPFTRNERVCVGGGTAGYASAGDGFRNFYTACSEQTDPRFVRLASLSERSLLNATVNEASGSPCVRAGGSARVTPFSNNGTCRAGDRRCENIMELTQCEKAQRYAAAPSRTDTWDVMYRSEVYWSSDCPVPRTEVEKNVSPINEALDLQYALLVVNIVFNVLAGFLIPILLIYNAWAGDVPCVPYEGQAEKNLIKFIKVWLSAASKIGKLIPLILVLLLVQGMLGFLERLDKVGDAACSDPYTVSNFEAIASALTEAHEKNLTISLPMDGLGLLVALFTIFRELTDGEDMLSK